MNTETLQSALEESGELMLNVEEFDEPLELHLHDTEFDDETITLQLADGTLTFSVDAVVGYWHHHHSLSDYGLD